MGYTCPVCDLPQHDAEHLANHLAMTALTHGDEHEEWLDEHVEDWSDESPATLGERVVPHAEEVPHETVFEDTTGGHGHDHGHGHDAAAPPSGTPPSPDTEAARAAVEEARRMRAEAADDEDEESAEDGS